MVCVVTLLYLQNKTLPLENTTDVLSTMASVCKVMLETPWVDLTCRHFSRATLQGKYFQCNKTVCLSLPLLNIVHRVLFNWLVCVCRRLSLSRDYTSRFNSEDTLLFCMRVMVGVIILYDHVHPNGAFNKSSKIDVSTTSNIYWFYNTLKAQSYSNVSMCNFALSSKSRQWEMWLRVFRML